MGHSDFLTEEALEVSEDSAHGGVPRPQRLRRQSTSRRLKVNTRQRPNNAAAKKGIHKRRNKHMAW
jgi:hypothetical protein